MMRHILLIRHGIATENIALGNLTRSLSPWGKKIQKKTAYVLAQQGLHIDRILYSPTLRTKETAYILSEVLQIPLEEEELLGISCDEHYIYEKIMQTTDSLALVGHAPSLFHLATLLIPNNPPQFQLEQSGILIITYTDQITWRYISQQT